jgi:hypothetical protein
MLWKVVLNATTNKKLFKIYSDKGLCDNKLSGTVFLYHWEQMKWQVNVWHLCYQSIISQTGMKMLLNLFLWMAIGMKSIFENEDAAKIAR